MGSDINVKSSPMLSFMVQYLLKPTPMKTMTIPYLKTLDILDLSSVNFVMEEKAHRDFIRMVNWQAYPYLPVTAFDIARGENSLYISFFCRGNSLRALNTQDGGPVHQDSCVAFFMKKPHESVYMSFYFNCLGACNATRRLSQVEETEIRSDEYARIRRYSTVKPPAFSERRGLYSWELVVAIPFDIMELNPHNLPEKIYGNFYKCADGTGHPHYVSWSPVRLAEPNFHCPEFFGEICF